MRTIFDETKKTLEPGTAPTLAELLRVAPELDPREIVTAFRASVSRRAFEDESFTAACWGCGEPLRRALVGLTCSRCAVVVPVDARPALPRYVFSARVAQGGQGTVWKALYEPLEDWRAVKAIPLLASERERTIRDEARRTNALKHPHIPRVHDVLRDEDTVFICMEWIEGETLQDANPRSLREAIEWVRLAAEGIGVAHGLGLVHRDVKPGNVMRSREGGIKVVDFGLALPVAEGAAGVAGTPAYMAPEVARGEPATPRSDVWGLGATLMKLMTGRAPVEREPDESPAEYLARRGSAEVALAGPPEVRAVLARCLDPDPARRYDTAGELATDLACCLDGRPVRAYRETLSAPSRWWYSAARHVDRNPVATIVAALLVISAVILTIAIGSWYGQAMQLGLDRELATSTDALIAARRATWRHDCEPDAALRGLREAARGLDGYVGRHPRSAAGLVARAQALRLLDDLAGAEADLRRARELEPGGPGALLALVLLERIELGELASTADLLERVRALRSLRGDRPLEPDEEIVLDALATRHLDGDLEKTRARLTAAQAATPSAELCLALCRLTSDPGERARWRELGLRSAPGDVRLRKMH
ncbi:serine/threonine protein kinase [bacterium]|nr:serine/threonine protein kinase [bacterium]